MPTDTNNTELVAATEAFATLLELPPTAAWLNSLSEEDRGRVLTIFMTGWNLSARRKANS